MQTPTTPSTFIADAQGPLRVYVSDSIGYGVHSGHRELAAAYQKKEDRIIINGRSENAWYYKEVIPIYMSLSPESRKEAWTCAPTFCVELFRFLEQIMEERIYRGERSNMKSVIAFLAQKLQQRYGTDDPYELCDNMGIIVSREALGKLEGCYISTGMEKQILLNEDLNKDQSRFVCAIGLGHAILHRNVKSVFIAGKVPATELEGEAHLFATELLHHEKFILETCTGQST